MLINGTLQELCLIAEQDWWNLLTYLDYLSIHLATLQLNMVSRTVYWCTILWQEEELNRIDVDRKDFCEREDPAEKGQSNVNGRKV